MVQTFHNPSTPTGTVTVARTRSVRVASIHVQAICQRGERLSVENQVSETVHRTLIVTPTTASGEIL